MSGVNDENLPVSSSRIAHCTSRVPETASQSDGSTRSLPGKSAARPTESTHRAAASIRPRLLRLGVLVELRLVDEDAARLRAFIATDDASSLEHVDQPARPRVADAQPPLDEGHRRGLRLHDDLDRLVEQRIDVGVELAVRVVLD